MADSYTPILGLTLPEIGASRDTWGSKLSGNFSSLDQFVGMATPIGAILDFAGPQPPSGWLVCDGRAVSRTTYSALFAVLGGWWGAGDGSTTFNLPNLTGRSSIGPGTVTDQGGRQATFGFATSAGYVWNVIGQGHLPNYQLYVDTQGYHSHGGATVNAGAHYHTTDAQGTHNHGNPGTAPAGGHNHSTDVQGVHNHTYQRTDIPGGAGGVIGSGFQIVSTTAGTSNDGAHGHNISWQGDHQHYLYWDGSHAHNTTWVGDHAHGIYGDGSHSHNVWLNGSGGLFEVLSPIVVVTKIIYAGKQATVSALALDVAGPMVEGRDELAALREELDQLRAMIGIPRQRRAMSSPLRGPH